MRFVGAVLVTFAGDARATRTTTTPKLINQMHATTNTSKQSSDVAAAHVDEARSTSAAIALPAASTRAAQLSIARLLASAAQVRADAEQRVACANGVCAARP